VKFWTLAILRLGKYPNCFVSPQPSLTWNLLRVLEVSSWPIKARNAWPQCHGATQQQGVKLPVVLWQQCRGKHFLGPRLSPGNQFKDQSYAAGQDKIPQSIGQSQEWESLGYSGSHANIIIREDKESPGYATGRQVIVQWERWKSQAVERKPGKWPPGFSPSPSVWVCVCMYVLAVFLSRAQLVVEKGGGQLVGS